MNPDTNSAILAERLRRDPVVAVLRSLDPQSTASRARELFAMGIRHVEVTIQDAQGVDALRATVESCAGQERHIGAGSVISPAMAELAVNVGADFLVSPGLSSSIVRAAQSLGVAVLPGVATPSEIQEAISLGLRAVKLFPASQLGGAGYVRALRGPFPEVGFVPTGGVGFGSINSLLEAGAIGVGLGSELTRDSGLEELERWLTQHNSR